MNKRITIKLNNNKFHFQNDFDPFNNRSCADIAKVYYAGKEVEYHVK